MFEIDSICQIDELIERLQQFKSQGAISIEMDLIEPYTLNENQDKSQIHFMSPQLCRRRSITIKQHTKEESADFLAMSKQQQEQYTQKLRSDFIEQNPDWMDRLEDCPWDDDLDLHNVLPQ